jgi:hypothetical protein
MGVAKAGRCQFCRTGNHRQVAGEKLPVKNVPVKNSQISTESKELEILCVNAWRPVSRGSPMGRRKLWPQRCESTSEARSSA